MSISPFIPGSFNTDRSALQLTGLRNRLTDLQRQLGSNKVSETFGGLGDRRNVSLDVRGRLSAIEGYQGVIQDTTTRIKLITSSLENAVKTIQSGNSELAPNTWLPAASGQTIGQTLARSHLDELADFLNENVNGRYLFSGRATDRRPVIDTKTILDGDGAGRAGVKQLIAERKLADLGTGDLGRLGLTAAGAAVTLTEDGNLNFGFRIRGATPTLANTTITGPGGPPASLGITFAGAPNDGESITLTLRLPDGSDEQVVLTARTDPTAAAQPGNFQIGAASAATAANFGAALQTAVQTEARTSLAASAATLASRDFFAGSPNAPPRRIAGPPFDTAAGFVPGTAANTVIWYNGDDDFPVNPASPGARATQIARIDTRLTIGAGAQANESGLRDALSAFAVAAAETFPSSDPNSRERYEAMTLRLRREFGNPPGGQRVQDIAAEIAISNTSIKAASERHRARSSFLKDIVGEIEQPNTAAVASEIVSLQTRLEASYQTTSIIGRLTLSSYLR